MPLLLSLMVFLSGIGLNRKTDVGAQRGIAVLKALFLIVMVLVAIGLIYTTITSMSQMFT
jgi:hypothetical protein